MIAWTAHERLGWTLAEFAHALREAIDALIRPVLEWLAPALSAAARTLARLWDWLRRTGVLRALDPAHRARMVSMHTDYRRRLRARQRRGRR